MAERDPMQVSTDVPAPDFVCPGVRCALEIALADLLVLYLGLPAENVFWLAFVGVVALTLMVVVLFWRLNRQMEAWIANARRTG